MAKKKVRIKFAKLDSRIDGLAHGYDNDVTGKWEPTGKIDIKQGLKGVDLLDTVIHEMLHVYNPEMKEREVKRQAREISRALWGMNYRRVEK